MNDNIMKALVLKEYNHFGYEDVPVPEIGLNDILVEVIACGICGSDVHGMDGSTGRRIPPIIMGHEASGIIAEVGENVSEFSKGERITFDSTIYCGKCDFCKRGSINLCDNRRVLGVSCKEYRQNGAFAEYIAVPERILYRLPDKISFEHATMIEALSIALHSVNRTSISINDTTVVVGAGVIGQLIIQLLKISGCCKIIAVDINRKKLELAIRFGADIGLNSNENDVQSEVYKQTKNKGADCVFEVVGIPQTIKTAVNSLRKGGSLTLIGNLSPIIELPLQLTVTKEISIYGSCASSGEYPVSIDLINRGVINVEPLISAVAPLKDGQLWFERLYKQESGLMKVILKT